MNRRDLLKQAGLGAAALVAGPLTGWRSILPLMSQNLVLRPYLHPLQREFEFAYAIDVNGDPFPAPIETTQEGVVVSPGIEQPFALSARWFVEGFGHVFLEADNGGQFFTAADLASGPERILNVEFARTQVATNAERIQRYQQEGTQFSTEVRGLHDLAQNLLEDAQKRQSEAAARLADQALLYGLWAGEKIELEAAQQAIARRGRRDGFYFGCETRHYVWAKSEDVEARFIELFNYATITHYVYDTWYEVFEPREGEHRWGIKDNILGWLKDNGITPEVRPLLWLHPWVTPEWLKAKTYPELLDYVERHARAVVEHYGDDVHHYEVVNEFHDWANVHRLEPDQITEVTRRACEVTREVNPNAERLINNCCTFAEYTSYNYDSSGEAPRQLRSPRRFIADLVEAEVPFEVVGVQMYFPNRSLQSIVRNVERFAEFGKPVYITEIGCPGGPTKADLFTTNRPVPSAPYDWHRPWDDDLQADWLEQTYTIFYSKPYIHNICWYDFADFRTFIPNGGLIREDGAPKLAYHRLKGLLDEWGHLPNRG